MTFTQIFVRDVPLACDARTFEVLGGGFARDERHGYFQGQLLPGADPRTLRHVRGRYACDARQVWAGVTLLDAKPETFRVVDEVLDFATDGRGVFRLGFRLEEAALRDASRFRVTDEHFVTDEMQVYCFAERLREPVALPLVCARFRSLGGGYGTDGDVVVHHAAILDGPRPETARVLVEELLVDGPFVFHGGERVEADGKTFEVLEVSGRETTYARDAQHVYSVQPGAVTRLPFDRQTFVALGASYGRDAQSVTYLGERCPDFDAASFEVLGREFGRDATRVYHERWPLDAAHRDSFRVLDEEYSVDAHHVFRRAAYFSDYVDGVTVEPIPGADPRTFVALPDGYSRDAKQVFFGAKPLDADPQTFVRLGGPFFTDGRTTWCGGEALLGATSLQHLGDGYARGDLAERGPFRVLSEGFATDGTDTWFHGHSLRLRGAVEALGHGFLRTETKAYFFELTTESRKLPEYLPTGGALEGADAASLRVLSPHHATDGRRVFFHSLLLDGLEAARVRVLSDFHVTDGVVLFAGSQRLEVDLASFEVLAGEYEERRSYTLESTRRAHYARDAHRLYAGGHPLSEPATWVNDEQRLLLSALDHRQFRALSSAFGTDGRYVFSFTAGEVLPQADPSSFVVLDGLYARDAFHVFHASSDCALRDVAPDDFTVFGSNFARCGDRVFCGTHEVRGVNAATFTRLNDDLGSDGAHVFRGPWPLEGADAASFEVLAPGLARDASALYFGGARHPLEATARPDHHRHGYWSCDDAVWWETTRMNADRRTFEVLADGYARDAQHVFFAERTLR